jgi:hypothetical protein
MCYLGLSLSLTRLKHIHLQYLEDKVAGKLVPWLGKHTLAVRNVLVEAVLTSVIIYFIACGLGAVGGYGPRGGTYRGCG